MTQALGQIAMSVVDLRATHRWYIDVLGFCASGGTEDFKGAAAETVMGVPGADTSCWWLVDSQSKFQIELFHFKNPAVRRRPTDWRPCDIGYSMIGVHVTDFDLVATRAAVAGTPFLTAPMGPIGARRACLRDPEGMLIEVLEDDPRGPVERPRPRSDVTVTTRFVTLSVPDLSASVAFFRDGWGLLPAEGMTLHNAEHETMWGSAGAKRSAALFWAEDILIELVQYHDPVGRPWPKGYRISDQGPLNMAFVYREKADLNRWFEQSIAAGATPNHRHIFDFVDWAVMYVNDPQGFSVELLQIKESFDGDLGFLPADPDTVVTVSIDIAAPAQLVWEKLIDHEHIGDWWCYEGRLIESGSVDPSGPGAVRELSNMGERIVEQVMAWVPLRRLDYRAVKGAPFDYHFARVELQPIDERLTLLTYNIRFVMPAGDMTTIVTELVRTRLTSAVDALKRISERESRDE